MAGLLDLIGGFGGSKIGGYSGMTGNGGLGLVADWLLGFRGKDYMAGQRQEEEYRRQKERETMAQKMLRGSEQFNPVNTSPALYDKPPGAASLDEFKKNYQNPNPGPAMSGTPGLLSRVPERSRPFIEGLAAVDPMAAMKSGYEATQPIKMGEDMILDPMKNYDPIYKATKPPTTRSYTKGDQEITEEWDVETGAYRPLATAPRYKPSSGGVAGAMGRTQEERYMNILLTGDPKSPQYAAAYAQLAAPKTSWDNNTGKPVFVNPDMSWAVKPGGTRGSAPGAAATPTTGQPTIVTGKQEKGVSADRATYLANVNQANRDIAAAKKLYFPGGKFDPALAATGVANVPWSKGREGKQALRRSVEIILRLRTGAAAPAQEVDNYTDMYAPSPLDGEDAAAIKMQQLEAFFKESQAMAEARVGGGGEAANAGDVDTNNPLLK